MSTPARRPPWRRDPLLLALVGLPLAGAVTTLGVNAYLASWDVATESVGWVLITVLMSVWQLLPFAGAIAVGIAVHRYWRGGSPVALLGGLLLLVLTVGWLWDIVTSESSTAAVGLFFGTFWQAALVGLTLGGATGLAALRRRRTARAS